MVQPYIVEQQLKNIGVRPGAWNRAERRELPKLMFEDEVIKHLINGHYEGGFAMLCATNYRVILIDKKPLYLTVEDIRYEMISDVMYNHRLLDATIIIGTLHKSISFTGYNTHTLKEMTVFTQQKALEARSQQFVMREETLGNLSQQDNSDGEGAFDIPIQSQPKSNPYKMPVMIRNRASKYF